MNKQNAGCCHFFGPLGSFLYSTVMYNHDFYIIQIIVVAAKSAAEPAV